MIYYESLLKFLRESNLIEGIKTEPSPNNINKLSEFLTKETLTIGIVEDYVAYIQPRAILRSKEGLNVKVGSYTAPLGGSAIANKLEEILTKCAYQKAAEFPVEITKLHNTYESLHPFTDGNGRSGRAIWLWMSRGFSPLGFLHQYYYDTLSGLDR